MKKLTRMKLINWHRFENCIIDFDGSTLISGENGSGKSTLLDAIQFVVLCSSNSFNKAAHEAGGRKLTGYIRCKSGRENRPYERTGQISAHVALEFYEESRDAYFIIGAAVDSASEGAEAVARYLIDNARLDDEMFFQNQVPRSIAQFHAANLNIKQWCKTQAEARKMVKSRLGRLEDKFFRLIPKALAFKPIDDIKDFVYSYVLDAKEVNVDVLRENVRTYQELEATLSSVRRRIERLQKIERYHTEVEDCMRRDRMYEYYLTRAEADITSQKEGIKEGEIREESYRLESARQQKEKQSEERGRVQEMEMNLRLELRQDKDFLALEEQKRQLDRLRNEEEKLRAELRVLKNAVRRSLAQIEKLLSDEASGAASGTQTSSDGLASPVEKGSPGDAQHAAAPAPAPEGRPEDPSSCLREYRALFRRVEEIEDPSHAKDVTENVIAYKRTQYEKMQRHLAEARIYLEGRKEELQDLKRRIADLERRKLSYPEGTERLIGAIRAEMTRLDRRSQPHVLCEVLEIADEEWRNAVEGYLNTQRFYVLVEPDNYDLALGVYERLRRQGKVYGVGLINAEKLTDYDTAPEGTLATKVETGNRYARRYANMILGKVQLCERADDLKKYSTSITKECMCYHNRVARAIRPDVYSVPFIGKHAYKVQLEQAKQKETSLRQEIEERRAALKADEARTALLSVDDEKEVSYHLAVLTDLASVRGSIRVCEESIRELEQNTTMLHKQIQLQELEDRRKKLDAKVENLIQTIGSLEASITFRKSELEKLKWEVVEKKAALTQLADQAGDELGTWEREYEKQTAGKSFDQFYSNYDRTRKANETNRQKAERQMIDGMIEYKTAHDFGAAASMAGYPEFAAVYDRLVKSELLEYENKVQSARETAETEFREQFLARLQENMKKAQTEFRDLNRALKDITFSSDRYEFLCMPGKRNRGFYEMIMDDYNIEGGQSLFSGAFYEKYREVIDELFRRLAGESESSGEILEEYTDYRTYMDYDIKIIHADGTHSLYSKVCEEKSGGETQTPFYVTVAASFVQLYGNSISGEAAGLVMFDEAFNNMDDERIGGVLEFMNRLPLQIIISAPPEKIQYIAPKMSETLLIMTDGRVSYAEEYHVKA